MNGEIKSRHEPVTNIIIALKKGYRSVKKEPANPVTENKTIKIGITINRVLLPRDQKIVLKQHKVPPENVRNAIGNDKISPITPQIFSFAIIFLFFKIK